LPHVNILTYFRERIQKMKLVTVLLPEAYLEGLDELVRANMYPSRSSVIRSAVRDLLKKELWEKSKR
jgi:Arc/MetJ-type ribon-helix-helix transcriptional regulator